MVPTERNGPSKSYRSVKVAKTSTSSGFRVTLRFTELSASVTISPICDAA